MNNRSEYNVIKMVTEQIDDKTFDRGKRNL